MEELTPLEQELSSAAPWTQRRRDLIRRQRPLLLRRERLTELIDELATRLEPSE